MTSTKVTVECKVCSDKTIFTDDVPDNDHIIKTDSTPEKYYCRSCGNFTDQGQLEPFVINTETYGE